MYILCTVVGKVLGVTDARVAVEASMVGVRELLDASTHKPIGILAFMIPFAISRAVPFHRTWRQFCEADTLHVEPLPIFALLHR